MILGFRPASDGRSSARWSVPGCERDGPAPRRPADAVTGPARPVDLSPERRSLAKAAEESLLVIAGPGAGKTRLVAAYGVFLAERGQGRVVALTFTRAAAAELKRRIVASLAAPAAERVVARTIHSHALDLLRGHGHRLGLRMPLEAVEEADVDGLADEVASEADATPAFRFSRRLAQQLRQRVLEAR